jgi:hypothetical protein
MKLALQIILCAFAATAFPLHAQSLLPPAPVVSAHTVSTSMPPQPKLQSPVTFFRQLLALSPAERNAALTNRPPEARAKILAKVREYLALDPDERELRLCATELRWHLTPLMRLAPAERETRLAQVPDDLQDIVKSRLSQWDLLPPPLQQELLANDKPLRYFAAVEATNSAALTPEQQKVSAQFNQFFALTPAEKKKTLATLSAPERAAMEKTLKSFENLPPSQRLLCLRNYAKFAEMKPAERTEFLKNAETWSRLSPTERQTWRDLVARVPIMPPMPQANVIPPIMPPMPGKLPRNPPVATN